MVLGQGRQDPELLPHSRGRQVTARKTAARVQGISSAWLVLLPVVWGLVPTLSWATLPQIAPGDLGMTRPLEMFGTAVLAVSVAHMAWPLGDEAPWLSSVSARGAARQRVGRFMALSGLCAVAAAVTGLVLVRAGVDLAHFVGVGLLLWALAVAGAVTLGRRAAAILPVGLMLISSRAHLIPWDKNVVFNEMATGPLWALAVACLAGAGVAFAYWGEGIARREVRSA